MCLVKPSGHTVSIAIQRILQQLIGCLQNPHNLRPAADAHGILKFSHNLLIGDECLLLPGIIRQIPQVDQQCKHVILCPEIPHVILKAPCVDADTSASEHLHNIPFEPVVVHFNIDFQGLVGFRCRPVIGKFPAAHCLHHGFRIVYMLISLEFITVIPAAGFRKVHAETPAQRFHFLFRKARVFFKVPLVGHGIFPEHVQSRMQSVFFYGQDACHIDQGHILLVFQKIPQEIQILPLQCFRLLPLPHDTVPLVYQENELLFLFRVNSPQRPGKPHIPPLQNIHILLCQFLQNFLFQIFCHFSLLCFNQKLLHIQINDIITVQILWKRFMGFYLKSCKQFPGITAPAIIGSQHLKRHGLSKTPGPADTDILFFCAQQRIRTPNQIRLIHIDFRTNRFPKSSVARIQIYSHKRCYRLPLFFLLPAHKFCI